MTICILNFSNLLTRGQTKQKKGSRVSRIDVAMDLGLDPATPELVVSFFRAVWYFCIDVSGIAAKY